MLDVVHKGYSDILVMDIIIISFRDWSKRLVQHFWGFGGLIIKISVFLYKGNKYNRIYIYMYI